MQSDLEKLFTVLKTPQPDYHLAGNIISSINQQKRLKKIKTKLFLYAVTTLGSALVLVLAVIYFNNIAAELGLWQYLSLLFSDADTLVLIWQNYLMSLAQALPWTGLILILASVLILFESIKLLAVNINKIKIVLS